MKLQQKKTSISFVYYSFLNISTKVILFDTKFISQNILMVTIEYVNHVQKKKNLNAKENRGFFFL